MAIYDLMIDINTLDTRPTAAIISLAAVRFCVSPWVVEVDDSFVVNVDPKSCGQFGLTMDSNTLAYWKSQPKEIRSKFSENPISLGTALDRFTDWAGKTREVWFNGVAFDYPIFVNAFSAVKKESPFITYCVQDMQTMLKITGKMDEFKRKREEKNISPYSLDTALFQAQYLGNVFSEG